MSVGPVSLHLGDLQPGDDLGHLLLRVCDLDGPRHRPRSEQHVVVHGGAVFDLLSPFAVVEDDGSDASPEQPAHRRPGIFLRLLLSALLPAALGPGVVLVRGIVGDVVNLGDAPGQSDDSPSSLRLGRLPRRRAFSLLLPRLLHLALLALVLRDGPDVPEHRVVPSLLVDARFRKLQRVTLRVKVFEFRYIRQRQRKHHEPALRHPQRPELHAIYDSLRELVDRVTADVKGLELGEFAHPRGEHLEPVVIHAKLLEPFHL